MKRKMQEERGHHLRRPDTSKQTSRARAHRHTHYRAHAGFFEELWCFVVTLAHLAGGGLNMGSIMVFDRSSQVDGVDSLRWAENAEFPGGWNVSEAHLWTPGFTELKKKKIEIILLWGTCAVFWKNVLFFIKFDNLQVLLLQQIINMKLVITLSFIYLTVLLADAPKCSHTPN